MTIYIQRKRDSYINGYTVGTGVMQTDRDYTQKVVAWFKTMEEAIDYAKYLILHQPVGAYDTIVFGKEEK